jgi:hypothetical protein
VFIGDERPQVVGRGIVQDQVIDVDKNSVRSLSFDHVVKAFELDLDVA